MGLEFTYYAQEPGLVTQSGEIKSANLPPVRFVTPYIAWHDILGIKMEKLITLKNHFYE